MIGFIKSRKDKIQARSSRESRSTILDGVFSYPTLSYLKPINALKISFILHNKVVMPIYTQAFPIHPLLTKKIRLLSFEPIID
jgi:hypothetical protein